MPIEPPATGWVFPDPNEADEDLVAVGADLAPGTLLSAYRLGLFPMPVPDLGLAWWCPTRRGVLTPGDLHASKSLRRSVRRYRTTVDEAFGSVLEGCADPARPGGWIDDSIAAAYLSLHELGWAHSVEVWRGTELAGGLYGVALGGLFAGESMFHRAADASKVALVRLEAALDDGDPRRLIDVQWATPHLRTLGVVEISRREYLRALPGVLAAQLPTVFDTVTGG
jgi:leucyl/phenylalanyl-tRNA---protein transferase